jgi:hypothetical protein
MEFEQAKKEAVRIFGAGTTLHKDKSGWCYVQDAATKNVLGRGRSWLDALREAAAPILQQAEAKAEIQRRQDMAEFERFLTFLREHLKDPYLAWRKARDEENKKRLEEEQKLSAEVQAQVEEDLKAEEAKAKPLVTL